MLALLTTLAPGFASMPTSACVPTEPVTNFEEYVRTLGDSAKEVSKPHDHAARMNTRSHVPPFWPHLPPPSALSAAPFAPTS